MRMPLKALINGNRVISPLLSDEEWEALKASTKKGITTIRMTCCDSIGHPRTSKLGTNHFYHHPEADCRYEPESVEHLKIKVDILQLCAKLGWAVDTEYEGSNWTADVLASKDGRKIAFELQLSKQTLEETVFRTNKYKTDGIECYWLFQKIPSNAKVINSQLGKSDVNVFEIKLNENIDQDYASVDIGGKTISLPSFVEGVLLNKMVLASTIKGRFSKTCKKIVFFPVSCWKCSKECDVYYVTDDEGDPLTTMSMFDMDFVSDCGLVIQGCIFYDIIGDDGEEFINIPFNPKIIEIVNEFVNSAEGKSINLAPIKERYSNTAQESYISFGCPYCDALFGDWFYPREIENVEYGDVKPTAKLDIDIKINTETKSVEYNHWCYPSNGEYCNRLK